MYDVGPSLRRLLGGTGVFVGIIAGYSLSLRFGEYLLLFGGLDFGETDSVFGRDIGFYVFALPTLWTTWAYGLVCLLLALIASVASAYAASRSQEQPDRGRLSVLFEVVSTRFTVGLIIAVGVVVAMGARLSRYDLLIKDNGDSAVYNGATYVDITGFFMSGSGRYFLEWPLPSSSWQLPRRP